MSVMVYNLGAANPCRTFPPAQGATFIRLFLDEFPEWEVKVIGLNSRMDRKEPGNAVDEGDIFLDEYLRLFPQAADTLTPVHYQVGLHEHFSDLIPIIQSADLVVGPDSAVIHLAAAFSVPTISLWGPFHPDDRVRYYPNHHPLVGHDACSLAPCRTHDFALPVADCQRGGCNPWQGDGETLGWCGALASIEPMRIVEECRKILKTPTEK